MSKLVLILFKHSVLTSKKIQPITITKISWLMLFREIIVVYSENLMKPTNKLCGQNAALLIIKAGGAYSIADFKGLRYNPDICLEGLRKTTNPLVRITGLLSKI
jgi:hypothetical protein